MKKGYYFGFGCLTSIVLLGLFFVAMIVGISQFAKTSYKQLKPSSALVVELKGEIPEYSRIKDDKFFFKSSSVSEIVDAIKKATYDVNIDALILKPEMLMCGYASINEIIEAIEYFKKSGKAVTSFVTIASNADMLIASTAGEIVISESSSAGVMLKGYGVNRAYYKSLFDKFGIKVHVISAGKYKDYGTQYSHTSMSDESRTNIERVLESRYTKFINQLGKQKDLVPLAIDQIIKNESFLILNNSESVKTGLVDDIKFEIDYETSLEKYYDDTVSIKEYLASFKVDKKDKLDKNIAVLYLNGSIMPLESDFSKLSSGWINDAVEDILADNTIKACVVRVNSPGGSALESEKILRVLQKLKSQMPVVVSMGNVAASGGYMISCVGDYIFADPYTITGSIGVVQLIPELKDFQESIGINHEKVEYGKKSDWLNPLNGISETQKQAYKNSADNVYNSFKTIVMNGRSNKFSSLEEVEKVAQGQVWDAESALENGLIDEIGSLTKAAKYSASKAKIDQYQIKNFPVKKDIFELFMADQLGLDQVKTMLMKNTSNTLYEQKVFFDAIKNNSIQTLMPISFDN